MYHVLKDLNYVAGPYNEERFNKGMTQTKKKKNLYTNSLCPEGWARGLGIVNQGLITYNMYVAARAW